MVGLNNGDSLPLQLMTLAVVARAVLCVSQMDVDIIADFFLAGVSKYHSAVIG
ncbi:Hypothetical protein, putative [Bodo saltans]|uniref:GPI-anchored surface protein n=1 Tax=Bodo saltans TaxID=75058 RepID=A0A0S4IQU0_BODSA|nr:Hypothetical protein, putative [Bodo saltans]|eukprot:CUE72235.1 Hypothetical protein, putative [Bodo saltans]